MKIHTVLFYRQDDDYKDCSVNIFGIKSFVSKLEADTYLNNKLLELILDEINDYEMKIPKAFKKYFDILEDDNPSIKDKYRNNFNVIELLYKEFLRGEYIDFKIKYIIENYDLKE